MPTTLTYGRKTPINGERNWWTTLTDNITRDDAHDHDGTDSALISSVNISKPTSSISSGSWSSVASQTGTYEQTITVPATVTINNSIIKFYVNGGGEDGDQVFLTWEKASSTQIRVLINDNSLSLVAVYG